MGKVTLDMATFKALASDTRLGILKALDGKRMALKDISKATNLNKATLHEHLSKLNEAGLVKKNEREGHKWVFYKLTWKGECLLHPENTRIVVLFSITFLTLFVGIIQIVNYVRGVVIGKVVTNFGSTPLYTSNSRAIDVTDHSFEAIIDTAAENFEPNKLYLQTPNSGSIAIEETSEKVGSAGGEALSDGIGSGLDGTLGFGASDSSNTVTTQILTWHNPALQWLAIVCIIIFGILLSIGIWRLWKNKKTKM